MKIRALILVVSLGLGLIGGLGTVAPASATKPASGSFTTTLTLAPTTVDGTDITLSGDVTATISRFTVQDGRIVAVADASGTLTASSPTLGTATLVITDSRLILNANVTADCQGNLHIDFQGVLQVQGTLTFTDTSGTTTTVPINETIPLNGSLDFTAETTSQTSLICDISRLLQNRSSAKALADKLNTLLAKI